MSVNNLASGKELDNMVKELLVEVGLKPSYLKRYPHAFSGGQRQRIGIARALIMNPNFIVADESVSALDVSVQAQILELLLRLKEEFDLSYLFIAHDLSVIKYICDRVGVMYVGKMVELADTDTLYEAPLHPYTEALFQAIPRIDPTATKKMEILKGEVPNPASPPSGCYFHPRCKYAKDICKHQEPEFRNVAGEDESPHYVSCHFAGELDITPAY
jgi:peptide/nickel transport system ATP-binding protein